MEGESTSRVEKRFIGSFCMPFETVYREGRIEGVFRVDTPTINFGYDHAASSLTAGADNSSGMFVGGSSSNDDSAPAAPNNNDHHRPDDMLFMAQTGLLGALDCFLQCLVSSNVKKPQEYDSLYSSSSSFIHRRTQVRRQASLSQQQLLPALSSSQLIMCSYIYVTSHHRWVG